MRQDEKHSLLWIGPGYYKAIRYTGEYAHEVDWIFYDKGNGENSQEQIMTDTGAIAYYLKSPDDFWGEVFE